MPFRRESISELCELAGISQGQLARDMGVGKAYISHLKTRTYGPSIERLDKLYEIAEQYGVQVDFFVPPSEDQSAEDS